MIDFSAYPLDEKDLSDLAELEIDMAFQPIFDAKDLNVVAYEALMRPAKKSPMTLIDEYQDSGKLSVIELATYFGATHEFLRRGYSQRLCINSLPSEALTQGQSEAYYKSFPEMEGRVVVEIVEYTELDQDKWAAKRQDIEEHGLELAIDDYSAGNNNMDSVDYFRPSYVKLDRKLISNIDTHSGKQEQVVSLVKHFHQQGMKVVAEGIERKEELDYLRDVGKIDFVQGFYLGRPQ